MNKKKFVKWFPISRYLLLYMKIKHLSPKQMKDRLENWGNWPYDEGAKEE